MEVLLGLDCERSAYLVGVHEGHFWSQQSFQIPLQIGFALVLQLFRNAPVMAHGRKRRPHEGRSSRQHGKSGLILAGREGTHFA